MPRKSALLLSLLNLVVKPIAEQSLVQSNQLVVLSQHSPTHDREAWCAYWKAQEQPWRTEPEIDKERQKELNECRKIVPDIEKGIYPFKGMKLSRADMEWLLAISEKARGLVRLSDKEQGESERVDLRGADLREVNLDFLPLVGMCGGIGQSYWRKFPKSCFEAAAVHLEGASLREAHLEGATLLSAHLEEANLHGAHLEGTNLHGAKLPKAFLEEAHLAGTILTRAHLEGADFSHAHFEGKCVSYEDLMYLRRWNQDFPAVLFPTDLRSSFFDVESTLREAILGNPQYGFISVADVRWSGINLAMVKWSQVNFLGDERKARQKRLNGKVKDRNTRLIEYQAAVRANHQLAVALQSQGLNEDAMRFSYRARALQKRVFWFEMIQQGVKLRQCIQVLGAWLFSWFLFLLAGYGYKLWRSFLAYVLVIIGFAMAYYLLGASFKPPLSLVNALGLSMTSFHGRGFFPGVTQLNDTLTILASIEAFVGLVLEATFIATLTQRFFGK